MSQRDKLRQPVARSIFTSAFIIHPSTLPHSGLPLAESSLIGVWFGVAKLSRASCYKSDLMKSPIYAALDLHSRHSVLGSMDHHGQTQPRMRFPTEASILRAQVERLRRKRQPLYLTMEAGALTRWDSGIVRPLVEWLIICEARHNRLIHSNPTKSDEADVDW